MKTKILSLLVALWCMWSENVASAQFYDSYNYYLYIEVGKTIESTSNIYYVHFNSDGNLCCTAISKSAARKYYKDNILDEYAVNLSHNIKYCSTTSTSRYEVYKKERTEDRPYSGSWYPGCPFYETVRLGGYWFRAFSLNRDEMIYWYTTRDSNEAKGKKYYKRIKPEDLIPKDVDYDFL